MSHQLECWNFIYFQRVQHEANLLKLLFGYRNPIQHCRNQSLSAGNS
uniref:Uncharacterized protein n=1 Tax=Rhizophora mucronata TaxID=61149 RepID=A0A2P2P3K6_RHIMU